MPEIEPVPPVDTNPAAYTFPVELKYPPDKILPLAEIFPAVKLDIIDGCGAGDTFLSAFVYQYLSSKDMEKSIQFAIEASSITVQHLGCYAPTLTEILSVAKV